MAVLGRFYYIQSFYRPIIGHKQVATEYFFKDSTVYIEQFSMFAMKFKKEISTEI